MTGIDDSLIVIDGLVISKWSREVFVDMRKGGLTAANCTCSIWEGFAETMRNIARWTSVQCAPSPASDRFESCSNKAALEFIRRVLYEISLALPTFETG